MTKSNMNLEETLEKIFMKNEPYKVPQNWVWIKLDKICSEIQDGYSSKAYLENIGPHFLRKVDIERNKINWNTVPYCFISEEKYKKYKLNKNDIVLVRSGLSSGKSYLINKDMDLVFASNLIRVKINNLITIKYISYFMSSDLYWKQIRLDQKEYHLLRINAQKLRALLVPMPPLKEQQRIVFKIESFFEKLDKARDLINEVGEGFKNKKSSILNKHFIENLTNIEMQIHIIKQSILDKAFRGELGTNCEADESALELLKEILCKN